MTSTVQVPAKIHSANIIYGFLTVELKGVHVPELSLGIVLEFDRMTCTGACLIVTVVFSIVGRLGTEEDPIIEHHEQRVWVSEIQVGEYGILNKSKFTNNLPRAYGLDKDDEHGDISGLDDSRNHKQTGGRTGEEKNKGGNGEGC